MATNHKGMAAPVNLLLLKKRARDLEDLLPKAADAPSHSHSDGGEVSVIHRTSPDPRLEEAGAAVG